MSSVVTKEDILQQTYGYSTFREGQAQIIDMIMGGTDVLAVMPTSAGKSLCYQIPALMLPGITLVISPLISLMKDQVDALRENGVRARQLNSSLDGEEFSQIYSELKSGETKILYIAPERLMAQGFREFISNFEISFIAVDEAHCISSWGHDFRPAYRNIRSFIEEFSVRPRIAAFTGTATKDVQKDIATQLGMNAHYHEVILSFDRPNLYFAVEEPRDKFRRLVELLNAGDKNDSTIIYCRTRAVVEKVATKLRKAGFSAGYYHAGLSTSERSKAQEDFLYGDVSIMVATNAFGMGIDKADVRQVIHYGISNSLEAYYQEAGRAGRDGDKSRCTLFYSGADVIEAKRMIDMENNPFASQKLDAMIRYGQTSGCLRRFIMEYFGEETFADCQDCSNCLDAGETVDITEESLKILSCVYRIRERVHYDVGINKIAAILKGRDTADLRERGLTEISTYGLLKNLDEKLIKTYIQVLIADGYLAVAGQYSVVQLTYQGREQFKLRSPIRTRTRIVRNSSSARSLSSDIEIQHYPTDLYELLKEKRMDIARKNHRQAFMIFSDKTLRDMAVKQPRNRDEFLNVYGVGKQKAQQYADEFTRVIIQWKA
ncbi:DNA helicase RecQ [Alloscardovia theropitheci]|uniref:DNA helicase RecQ n=1 Tax=Alloscardovia theropitheci TaxID=2496842 RepID=A0A4R0R1K7_9BIFI|nr:DNA helicase RecQ [Alloscardovia theropitheci]TCD55036.1 DNA helicase RecQ [Alloscardovia theropitheci]